MNQNPVVYRQQTETAFLTYNFYNDNHWEVVDKSGNTFYFGQGTTNQMENPKSGWTYGAASSTFRWALNKVLDANGNLTTLSYTTDGNVLYLSHISYNGNINSPTVAATYTVDFLLGSRPDTNITFLSGYRVTTAKRLSEIQVKASGQNVRRYVLGYTSSPSTTRSLLSSVTQYGSDFATALPPVTFGYQIKPFTFGPDTNWNGQYSQGQSGPGWNSIRAYDSSAGYYTTMADIDGDGLPDRVMRSSSSPYDLFVTERNTGTGFAATYGSFFSPNCYSWGWITDQAGSSAQWWGSPTAVNSDGATVIDLIDINGDGYPDWVQRQENSPYTAFYVQLNNGTDMGWMGPYNSFSITNWGGVTNYESTGPSWGLDFLSPRYKHAVDMVDMNGDRLPDRVSRKVNSPYDRFEVQLNNGAGFNPPVDWLPLDSQGQTVVDWNAPSGVEDGGYNYKVVLQDINGDGLPDRVMRQYNSPYTTFWVQFNNGAGFESAEQWGPVDTQGSTSTDWGSPIGTGGNAVWASLVDINGDGLPDHVMRVRNSPYTNWVVQLNTGTGFGPTTSWGPVDSQTQPNDYQWNSISYKDGNNNTVVDFLDINGDGLPDRVMRVANSPYNHMVVQLNQGPFPDLLNVISNGLGASAQVTYAPSTSLNNRDQDSADPWTSQAKSLLPFNVWVVSQVLVNDGLGALSTNNYAFKGGYYYAPDKEFRGFSQVAVTDPLGTITRTYFHQSGGRDNSSLGEYLDQGSMSKKGIPFRSEVVGSDGLTNKITLNKVEEVELNPNGWYFPYISQTISMVYEGLSSYRATAKQFTYETNFGNLIAEADLGEVSNVSIPGQTFTDIGSDALYTWISYASLGNVNNKPSDTKVTSDAAGSSRLRETLMFYDNRGNLTNTQAWLDTAGVFVSIGSGTYDQYGNPVRTTDAAGITTTIAYDPTYQQYPITLTTATFTNQLSYNPCSGVVITAIDPRGLVASNTFDVFFRSTATYVSTNAYGAASLWKTRTSYSLGGVANGISYNYIHKQQNDAVDPLNGLETYDYMDGLGKTIQSRTEAENGQFRVVDTLYDERGKPNFQTVPYFSSGAAFTLLTGTHLGGYTEYDDVGRAFRTTPATQAVFDGSGVLQSLTLTGGDSGSPVGATTTAFFDGSNPWVSTVTAADNTVRKYYHDAYGRVVQVVEVTASGSYSTSYAYDLVGNVTNVTDAVGHSTRALYDSLGRKTSTIDPDMGVWTYVYDNAGRLVQQTDARTNTIRSFYEDALGRLSRKEIWNPGGYIAGAVTNIYDVSDDPNYTVFPGQLYKVVDAQGYQKESYDVRGRVTKSSRYLNINSAQYDIQTAYDDADRVVQVTYPGNAATIRYSYDTGGNLIQVKSTAGTGTQEIFYTPLTFDQFGRVTSYTNGNGVLTTNSFYANSGRLQRLKANSGGTARQDLAYTYDSVSDLKSTADGVFSGGASASLTNIMYDDFHRVLSLNSTARGFKSYSYDALGNILTNQDNGSGLYLYGAQPHAVTNANGMSYRYDACGNMTVRGSQTLTYDEQNRLSQVSGPGLSVSFGYAANGTRLWRYSSSNSSYTIWIGGLYEIKDGKTLCHVFAGGKRIASFEPQGGGPWASLMGPERWATASVAIAHMLDWPLQEGRAPLSFLLVTFCGILVICLVASSRSRAAGRALRYPKRAVALWKQAVTFTCMAALILATTETRVEAQTYNPVFYYYLTDQLGSSNVLLDRSGQMVEHYEYSSFGQTTFTDNGSAFQVSNRYTGQIVDDETGLYYYGCRYYDPGLGRFIQPDTVVPGPMNPQALNRYSYCANNPLNLVDPNGHGFFQAVAGFFKANFNAAIGYWSSPQTWEGIGIGFALGGLWGGVFAAGIGSVATDIGSSIAYISGDRQAGIDATFAVSLAASIYGIYNGIGMVSNAANAASTVAAAATIASSGLSAASASAGFVGEQQLSGDLGYASLGAAAAGSIAQHWDAWSHPLRTIDESTDAAHKAVDILPTEVNDNKYGHATQLSFLQRAFGPVAAPLLAAGGVLYEVFTVFFPGHTQNQQYGGFWSELNPPRPAPFFGLFDGQNPINWLYDTPGDIIGGDLLGQITGLFLDPETAASVNKAGFLMPGPNYSKTPFGPYTYLAVPGARWPW